MLVIIVHAAVSKMSSSISDTVLQLNALFKQVHC